MVKTVVYLLEKFIGLMVAVAFIVLIMLFFIKPQHDPFLFLVALFGGISAIVIVFGIPCLLIDINVNIKKLNSKITNDDNINSASNE